MTTRNIAIASCATVIVAIVAFLYNHFLVAPIAPPDPRLSAPSKRMARDGDLDVLESRAPELAPLFPDPDDWRRTTANIVVLNDRNLFILSKGGPELSQNHKTVYLSACTLVFLNDDPNKTKEERVKDALVFESSDRTELNFIAPFTNYFKISGEKAEKLDIDKINSGHMRGEVTIRTRLGGVDVKFKTRDVVFGKTQIHSSLDVHFNIGPNSGVGRGLTLDFDLPYRLLRGEKNDSANVAKTEDDSPTAKLEKYDSEGNIGGGFSLKGILLAEISGSMKLYGESLAMFRSSADKTEEQNADDIQDTEETDATSFDSYGAGLVGVPRSDAQTDKETEEPAEDGSGYYAEVRCKNGLYFSTNSNTIGGWGLRFNKDVELVVFYEGAKTNQVRCDSLYLYLQDKELSELAEQSEEMRDAIERKQITGSLRNLVPTNVRAVKGEEEQAIARDFRSGVELNADEIRYDLDARVVDLVSEDSPVRITRQSERDALDFSAQNIRVQMNKEGEIEAVFAGENGKLNAVFLVDGKPRAIDADWKNGLYAAPTPERDGYLKISSSGSISFQAYELGAFYANEGDFWCRLGEGASKKTDPDAPPSFSVNALAQMKPILADFRGNVAFQSDRGTARVADSAAIRFDESIEQAPYVEETETRGAFGDFIDAQEEEPLGVFVDGEEPLLTDSLFEIYAKKLEVRCLTRYYPNLSQPRIDVARLTLRGNVLFRERVLSNNSERVRLQAEAVQIDDPNARAMKIRLLGASSEPALFRTEKLKLAGSDITVDSERNYFQVLGVGGLELASPAAKEGGAKSAEMGDYLTEEPINVAWTNSMQFDGKRLRFLSDSDKNVVVSQGAQKLTSPEVSLTLKDPLSIFHLDVNNKSEIDVETIECLGSFNRPVNVEARTIADSDKRVATYQATATALLFNVSSGKFTAKGSGRFVATLPSTGKGFGSIEENLPGGKEGRIASSEQTSDANWTKVSARFEGNIEGSIAAQEASILAGMRAVVATVADPETKLDVDEPDSCPEGTVSIESQEAYMKLFDDASVNSKAKRAMELEARKNVIFRQKDITGVCDSLRFSSLKNALVLTGSRSSKAAVYKQAYRGAQREELGTFSRATYMLDSQKFNVESLNFGE